MLWAYSIPLLSDVLGPCLVPQSYMHEEFAYLYFGQGRLFILLSILASLLLLTGVIFTLREANVYKLHGFFLGFLASFICFCVTVLFYRYIVCCSIKKRNKFRKISRQFRCYIKLLFSHDRNAFSR